MLTGQGILPAAAHRIERNKTDKKIKANRICIYLST